MASKRKADTAPSMYNMSMQEAYMFLVSDGVSKCLACFKILNTTKKFNLQRHYNTFHAKDYGHLEGEEREAEIQRLKNILLSDMTDVSKFITCGQKKSLYNFSQTFLLLNCIFIPRRNTQQTNLQFELVTTLLSRLPNHCAVSRKAIL